jgi:hypothetical protein
MSAIDPKETLPYGAMLKENRLETGLEVKPMLAVIKISWIVPFWHHPGYKQFEVVPKGDTLGFELREDPFQHNTSSGAIAGATALPVSRRYNHCIRFDRGARTCTLGTSYS